MRALIACLCLVLLAACGGHNTPLPVAPSEGRELADDGSCAEGWIAYQTQTGPKCIEDYGERLIRSWAQCTRASQCPSGYCVFASHTPDGQEIRWDPRGAAEFHQSGFRCAPESYANYLLHNPGMTQLDEDGKRSTVIA